MDAILLAAGNSTRFGANKLLYRWNGKPVYRYILDILYRGLQEHWLEHIIVVSQYEEIFEAVRTDFPGAAAVRNPAPELGISSSVRLGVEALERMTSQSAACLFAVADQPCFTGKSLKKMWECWQKHSYGILAASRQQKEGERQIGNPVIFASKYYGELKRLTGDTGGKRVLLRHMEDAGFCDIPEAELEDLDTPEELKRIRPVTEYPEQVFPFLEESGHVISLVGAGGKTTLMYTLAAAFARKGKRVVVTTTTHIRRPEDYPVVKNKKELETFLKRTLIVAAGSDAPEGKLTMSAEMTMTDYREAADIVLVEADGAKHFPCKVPAEKEPVIPEESDIVLGVVGMDALGRPLREVCFRKEKVMELLNVDAGHCMTEKDVVTILSSAYGTRKGVGGREYYIVLNKCDDRDLLERGARIQKMLKEKGNIPVVCTALHTFDRRLMFYGCKFSDYEKDRVKK